MKTLQFLFIIIVIIFSCNPKPKDDDRIVALSKIKDCEYQKIENEMIKVIRYFPDTKDIMNIYYLNINNERDSISTYYDIEGNIESLIIHDDITIIKNFSKNGQLIKESSFREINGSKNIKYFYENGVLKSYLEFIIINGEKYLNNGKFYDSLGVINPDSTFYFDILPERDTISINDSLLVHLYSFSSKKYLYRVFTGLFDENFNIIDKNKIIYVNRDYFFYKPVNPGKNFLRVIFEVTLTPNEKRPKIKLVFKEKEIFVKE
jgi:hypothetical protein